MHTAQFARAIRRAAEHVAPSSDRVLRIGFAGGSLFSR
ncbi:hypothetical protein BTZ20_2086 [Rhodococcus sp. MTM3W5.2]|nr:hypothetical protein BTZ20_2086 [Rhodococcus sp. MTM3W5.2]